MNVSKESIAIFTTGAAASIGAALGIFMYFEEQFKQIHADIELSREQVASSYVALQQRIQDNNEDVVVSLGSQLATSLDDIHYRIGLLQGAWNETDTHNHKKE